MKRYSPIDLCPLPAVDLGNIEMPTDGLLKKRAAFCTRQFVKGSACRDFYQSLTSASLSDKQPIQCPFGFSAYRFTLGGNQIVLTGFVPFPRAGGESERQRAKDYP